MSRVLRLAAKKCQIKEELFSDLGVSKKSKTIKRRAKKLLEAKDGNILQSDIWNINSILSNIFAYTDCKDLLEFNTVCKKWNYVSNPLVHKTIKLNRSWNIIKETQDKRFNTAAKIDADVVECISNNAKYANLINEINFKYKLEPRRAIEVFETFRYISKLTISHYEMSQDQFLGMINPLKQLQELTLNDFCIKRIVYKRLYKEAIQLPLSLKKLRVDFISLINGPELFIQTINSHNNLTEFSYSCSYDNEFLQPFYKPYPSLLNFEYTNHRQESPQSIINVIEQNRQLTSLKLKLNCWNSELTSYISRHLANLEELNITESRSYHGEYTDLFLKFSQPTKIKKLSLEWLRISSCSLDSILLNCPQLEELTLNRSSNYQEPNSEIFINLSRSAKVKKLVINCDNLSGSVVDPLLLSCYHLNELVITLPVEWREAMKSIYEKCENLQILDISPSNNMHGEERDDFFQELYETEFFTSNSNCKSSLTHLTLNKFNADYSGAEHFKKFEQLKSIKYPEQSYPNYRRPGIKADIDMELWPGYKLITKDNRDSYDSELKKIQS
jgi:hypothetical protein